MFGYKLTKDEKTICLGISDNLTDALQRAPGGKYKIISDVKNSKNKRIVTYESVGPRDGDYIDGFGDKFPIWKMSITHDIEDIIDIVFDEIKNIWND